ncbi:MAG: glycosyltransferase, partial [Saprospiraceae bacterium]|nr:glycosyltransferase [Saprospiraceae bacterium]
YFASRLVWEKNLKTLVKIYENAKRQKLPLNFIIAGDGMASDSLMKMMPEALFLGHVHHEELSSIYASCDVFVFTSISETYGNVVAEAMASGLPCVIANGGGSAHFVENGKNGFLCSPEDSLEYLEKIKLILTNEELRTSFIQEGLEFVAGLQWQQLTDIYFSDLHALVDAKKENYFIPLGMDYSF